MINWKKENGIIIGSGESLGLSSRIIAEIVKVDDGTKAIFYKKDGIAAEKIFDNETEAKVWCDSFWQLEKEVF